MCARAGIVPSTCSPMPFLSGGPRRMRPAFSLAPLTGSRPSDPGQRSVCMSYLHVEAGDSSATAADRSRAGHHPFCAAPNQRPRPRGGRSRLSPPPAFQTGSASEGHPCAPPPFRLRSANTRHSWASSRIRCSSTSIPAPPSARLPACTSLTWTHLLSENCRRRRRTAPPTLSSGLQSQAGQARGRVRASRRQGSRHPRQGARHDGTIQLKSGARLARPAACAAVATKACSSVALDAAPPGGPCSCRGATCQRCGQVKMLCQHTADNGGRITLHHPEQSSLCQLAEPFVRCQHTLLDHTPCWRDAEQMTHCCLVLAASGRTDR